MVADIWQRSPGTTSAAPCPSWLWPRCSKLSAIPPKPSCCTSAWGQFGSVRCRVIDFDVRERVWALDAVLDQLIAGTDLFRDEIARLH